MIIATLTTIRTRAEQGHTAQAILSILQQTTPPDRIYLFYSLDAALLDAGISPEEIAHYIIIPLQMAHPQAISRVIPIAVPNIGPYRKLAPLFVGGHIPTPTADDIIITFDDDHIYAPDTIAAFVATYEAHQKQVCVCSAAKRANLKGAKYPLSGITLPYVDPAIAPALHLIPEGFEAVLYNGAMLSGFQLPDAFSQHCMPADADTSLEARFAAALSLATADAAAAAAATLKTNDDVWFRLYTFAKGIRVIVVNTEKVAIINDHHPTPTLYDMYNKAATAATDKVIAAALLDPHMTAYMVQWPIAEYIDMEDEIYTTKELTNIRHAFKAGTDVKLLQYERAAGATAAAAATPVDFLTAVRQNTGVNIMTVLINIAKDQRRYASAVTELRKLGIPTFIHLKATYWRDREQFAADINMIADFLRQVAGAPILPNAPAITFDAFSTPNTSAIHIQDGPLACYCSHLRALIGAHIHGAEAVLICEDDISVSAPQTIIQAITQIPPDWDVITFNSVPIGAAADTYAPDATWYKMTGPFYSTHCYLVRNKALQTIFRAMWPITDQVDILLSRLYPVLNIYNVPNTVYQKNYSTNTQNNLWVILTSAGYEPIRARLNAFAAAYCDRAGQLLGMTSPANPIISRIIENAVIDVLYQYIENNATGALTSELLASAPAEAPTPHMDIPQAIYEPLHTIINCCVKGVGVHKACLAVIADIEDILAPFANICKSHPDVRPLGWGSTAAVFERTDTSEVYKIYHANGRVRWNAAPNRHRDPATIFNREVAALERYFNAATAAAVAAATATATTINDPDPEFIWRPADPQKGTLPVLIMPHLGPSLYDHFRLPNTWRESIAEEFAKLTQMGILYTEFNLKNICVSNLGKIAFIDFGLCELDMPNVAEINAAACDAFVELIGIIADKFNTIIDPHLRKVVYQTLVRNLKQGALASGRDFSCYIY